MICYRDMTFCPYWEQCESGPSCERRLTGEVVEKAQALGLPICTWYDKEDPYWRPDCWEMIRREVAKETCPSPACAIVALTEVHKKEHT